MQIVSAVIIIVSISICSLACRSTKRIQTAIAKKDSAIVAPVVDSKADSIVYMGTVYDHIMKNKIDYQTFSAKIKTSFQGADGKKSDFNAFVRMHKDSLIWVSINALLGIEAFRILITPDSVKVLNKIDKVAQLRSVSYLQEMTKIPFTFYDIQNLIIGNPIYLDSNLVSYKLEPNSISLVSMGELFKHLLTVNASDYTIQYSKIDDVDASRARTAYISYGNYVEKNNWKVSTYRKIAVSEKNKLDIEMDLKQFEFNEVLNYPFSIPKNYKSN